MTQLSKLKIILGLIYLLIVALVTYLFFYYEIFNYVSSDFIKNDRKVIITFKNGQILADELERANAHPAGAKPFVRQNYIHKFDTLTKNIITAEERNRFIQLCENLANLTPQEVMQLNVQVDTNSLLNHQPDTKGIF